MKITKLIAQFKKPNDGVVTVENSKFPEALQAVDLGVIHADHLAGILASNFPQQAFIEALVLTVSELRGFNPKVARAWFDETVKSAASLVVDYHQRTLSKAIIDADMQTHSILNLMGPLPEQTSSDENWFNEIVRERATLEAPLFCHAGKIKEFKKKISSSVVNSAYEFKNFELHCKSSETLVLEIESTPRPIWKFWAKPDVLHFEVHSLKELVTVLLQHALRSEKDLISGNKVQIPKSLRQALPLPANNYPWTPDLVIDLSAFGTLMDKVSIALMNPTTRPEGIQMIFDHQSFTDFRKEHGFSYESRSPGGMDDNASSGYMPILSRIGDRDEVAARLKTKNSSIRLTTPLYRFRPQDFANLNMRFNVLSGPDGADSAKGGSGKDDSAFQIWFTLKSAEFGVKVFGYYWAESADCEKLLPVGSVVENYYSNKDFIVAKLPESKQVVLGCGRQNRGQWLEIKRNLWTDLKTAFPGLELESAEVVAITLQTDSNDVEGESEVLFKSLTLLP